MDLNVFDVGVFLGFIGVVVGFKKPGTGIPFYIACRGELCYTSLGEGSARLDLPRGFSCALFFWLNASKNPPVAVDRL